MVPKDVRERYKKLTEEVNRHRDLYYAKEQPEISEAARTTSLSRNLSVLKKYPELASADSPTTRVGGEAQKGFKKVTHQIAQWSFNDAFSEDDMRDFDARVRRVLSSKGPSLYLIQRTVLCR